VVSRRKRSHCANQNGGDVLLFVAYASPDSGLKPEKALNLSGGLIRRTARCLPVTCDVIRMKRHVEIRK